MPNKGHILNFLRTHHPHQIAILFISPECNSLIQFVAELFLGHVGFLPTVWGDDPLIGLGRIVDDFVDGPNIAEVTRTNHGTSYQAFRESGSIISISQGDGYVVILPRQALRKGEPVEVIEF